MGLDDSSTALPWRAGIGADNTAGSPSHQLHELPPRCCHGGRGAHTVDITKATRDVLNLAAVHTQAWIASLNRPGSSPRTEEPRRSRVPAVLTFSFVVLFRQAEGGKLPVRCTQVLGAMHKEWLCRAV